MRTTFLRALVPGIAAAVLLTPAAPSSAGTVSRDSAYTDVPVQETGRISKVLDSDTFEFLAEGAGRATRVRLLGVNTPEVTGQDNIDFAEDMCAGREAEAQLERLLPVGTRVELRSLHKESANRGRILRYVFAYDAESGQYDRDISALVAESGLAMWFTVDQESALSFPYRLIIQQAQRGGRGIWDPNHCGAVEQPEARLDVTVSWDAPGADQSNLNGEFVIVRNVGTSGVDLSGWLLRDSSLTSWYYFPAGTVLTSGDFRIVHVGSGTPGSPTSRDLYMGSTLPLFPNTQDGKFLGDGAYLLDRSTAVRFYDEYPCITNCRDPLQGAVVIARVDPVSLSRVTSRAANEEYIVLRNTSTAPVLLDGYYLRRKVSTYPFPPGTQILPGKSLTVRIGKGAATATVQYWGRPAPLLTNRSDRVELLSNTSVVISRKQW